MRLKTRLLPVASGRQYDNKQTSRTEELSYLSIGKASAVFIMFILIIYNKTTNAGLIRSHQHQNSKIINDQYPESARRADEAGYEKQSYRVSRSIEFSSPMRKIMELIGHHHHAPVIVVSSNSDQPQPAPDQSEATNPAQQQTSQLTSTSQITSAAPSDNQQWTVIESNQPVQMLAPQQQQLIQTSIPYQQYYMAAPIAQQMSNIQQAQQVALVPAFTSPQYQQQQQYSPPVAYQPSLAEQQFNQQQQLGSTIVQQANGDEDRVQPIFLSSYVPGLTGSMATLQPDPNLPNSIQSHIQNSAQYQQPAVSSNTKEEQTQGENQPDQDSDTQSDEPTNDRSSEQNISNNNDDGGQDSGSSEGDEDPNGSGHMSYEDKYDSDKDEPNSVPSRNYAKQSEQSKEPPQLDNGLINVGLNDECLQCICRASSGCDDLLRCITRGAEEKYCGPFQLTEEYWNQAGSPGDSTNNFSSFEDCANDIDCAVGTVTNYMKKYHKDCDGDENITCMDYARLHRLKPDECGDTDKLVNNFDAYWAKFQRCAEGYNRSRTGEDEYI